MIRILTLLILAFSPSAFADSERAPSQQEYSQIEKATKLALQFELNTFLKEWIKSAKEKKRIKVFSSSEKIAGKVKLHLIHKKGSKLYLNEKLFSYSKKFENYNEGEKLLYAHELILETIWLASTLIHEADHAKKGFYSRMQLGLDQFEESAYSKEKEFILWIALQYRKKDQAGLSDRILEFMSQLEQ